MILMQAPVWAPAFYAPPLLVLISFACSRTLITKDCVIQKNTLDWPGPETDWFNASSPSEALRKQR